MATVPKEYFLIAEAGRGVTARVYYCLPSRQVNFITNEGPLTPDTLGFEGLKRSIVAVKVSPSNGLISREFTALQAIRKCTSPNASAMRRHFLDVKSVGEFGVSGGEQSCVALEAIDPPMTLADLLKVSDDNAKIPIPLVYHVFLTLMPALFFLKNDVQYVHNDIKQDNIMCRLYEGCPFQMPEFIFVDFGMSYSIEHVKDDSSDYKNLLGLVRELAVRAEPSDDQQWLDFKRMLDGEMNKIRWQVDADIGKIWEKWRGVAEAARNVRKVGEVDRVEDLFDLVVQKKGKITNEMIVKAVEE